MQTEDDTLLQFSNGQILPDGRFRFTIERRDGRSLTISCEPANAQEAIAFLAGIVKATNEAQGLRGPPRAEYFAPIATTGFGLATGRTRADTLLVVNLAGTPLAFEIPNSDLIRLAEDFSRAAKAATAPTDHAN